MAKKKAISKRKKTVAPKTSRSKAGAPKTGAKAVLKGAFKAALRLVTPKAKQKTATSKPARKAMRPKTAKKAAPKARQKAARSSNKNKIVAVSKPAMSKAEQRDNLEIPGRHNDEFQDDQRTSSKRRRTSGQPFSGDVREEQRRAVSMQVTAHQDERERIRLPRRGRNQNRSR